jgi:hypothetical protein
MPAAIHDGNAVDDVRRRKTDAMLPVKGRMSRIRRMLGPNVIPMSQPLLC